MNTPTQDQMDRWCYEGEQIARAMMEPPRSNRIVTWLFFTQPFRRMIVRLSMRLSDESRLGRWINDRLYPHDALVVF